MNSALTIGSTSKVKYTPILPLDYIREKQIRLCLPEHLGKERNRSNFLTAAGSIIFFIQYPVPQLSKFSNFSFGSRCDS